MYLFFSFLNSLGDSPFVSSQRHYHTSWLVPNKPLVNPPVRCFLQRDEEDSLSLSLFSLSLCRIERVFFFCVCSLCPFWIQIQKRFDVMMCTRTTRMKSVSKQRARSRRRDTRGRRRRNRRVSSLSFFRFFLGRARVVPSILSMLLG